ncbi:phosphate signaling complex protein PhoU [Acidipropionibacterium jensenii]|uniref:Phosphate-specific transport system accessory protein PhoU n=1 Tax=Acidipropionibacterium jensenii TaxID=1749 RepID=A0A3S4UT54_9ACTN|nr:phosphate signaling complex protein PhoU [Acidipropionibacterium jensenii]MDN5978547.1 phosphate signaling complex protein PhoU [Acidipropionibacterium jensenii]MDN5997380.1 phosphate signaling complex protein PhoU [Acidipropionibacterium jensenii]MDN6022130.1 phosphate signaling complex protein PhoU [Acidipropionibacterium jensenii]MDN6428036.1 phosphate signaling complex protein PhoU [Acidipropionibacterium jensenii]MDN6443033.1 phosphate signaling complex protein PhoU [Acidipropionibacte
MRESYHDELAANTNDVVTMSALVRTAVERATAALIDADLAVAEEVISADSKLDALHDEIEQRSFNLLARQAPVAGELRTVVAVLRMCYELSRMGDLAVHVAETARHRYPDHAVPDPVAQQFTKMATIADKMIATAGQTLVDRDVEDAKKLASQDTAIDDIRAEQFRMLLSDTWQYGVEEAVDTALLGRYYERIADHAVAIGSRVIYIVTGEAPEGEDWPKAF